MRDREDGCWLTVVKNDSEALDALVLSKSLKKVLTCRKRSVLISKTISHPMKFILSQEYDHVVTVDENDLNGQNEDFCEIFAWTLHAWSKIVYLSPKTLLRQNSDELFDFSNFSAPKTMDGSFDMRLFVFAPSMKVFDELLKSSKKSKNGIETIKNYFSGSKSNDVCGKLYAVEKSLRYAHEPKLIQFQRNLLSGTNNNGYEGEWLKTFSEDVLPFLRKQNRADEFVKSLNLAKYENGTGSHDEIFDDNSRRDDLLNSIAVVGMSCRFPSANSVEEYWEILSSGVDAIKNFPSNRPLATKDLDAASKMKAGFLTCPVDEFDAKLFGISPREAPFIDPQQRLLLEVTWESLESAGINPQSLKDSNTGVFLGIWQQDYERLLPDHLLSTNDFFHRYLGNEFSASASRISYCLGLHGPAIATESGCSSALGGLHLACESLRRGEVSLAIASGVNLVLIPFNPFSGKGEEAVVLSKDFHCKTFDESADGFVRAEGCGVVILKRYADAVRDNDNILALIRGSSLNNDGQGTSFGTPNAKAQMRVFQEALDNAGVKANEVKFVEAHGTGTVVGDPIEMYAIGQVYSQGRKRENPLIVSSVKTNIGHCEAAAGIASVIKMIICLQKGLIPPHLNLKTLNPRIDLDSIPAIIPLSLTPWEGENKLGAVSSFSMSGTNVHMVLQEAPKKSALKNEESLQLVTISAKSEEALSSLCDKYTQFLEKNPEISLYDFAYSANTGRANLAHRAGILAKDIPTLLGKISKSNFCQNGKVPSIKSKIGFLFTGQGSQYFGMGKTLYESVPAFQEAFDTCDRIFTSKLNTSLKKVVWEDDKLLEKTIFCQPAIFCIEYALFETWKSFGITPDYVLGHSVGEFAAAVGAGVLSLSDAMTLVISRSELVNTLESGAMLALRCPEDQVFKLIKVFNKESGSCVDIAAINSPEEIVVSGQLASVTHFKDFCLNNGVKFISIPASHAFHSRSMDSILADFGKVGETVQVYEPNCSYVSGTLAKVMERSEFTPSYWQRHLRDTVKFSEAVQVLYGECKILVEIGAQPILLGLAMGNPKLDSSLGYFCPSLRRNEEDLTTVLTSLCKLYTGGAEINWDNWFSRRGNKIQLPFYPFQRQKYWVELNDCENGMGLNTPLVHPLLGRQFPSPLEDLTFCHNLNSNELQWIDDHKVAERIILPAAAYLESFLAAGRQILQSGSKVPLTIENLVVESALEIPKPVNIQTIIKANHETTIQYKMSINRQIDGQIDKWKRHSSASFNPSSRLPDSKILDIPSIQNRLAHKDELSKVYEKIWEIGIQFGAQFQSIKSAWSGENELLTRIELPSDSEPYICHPIVLDAIIQTCAFRNYILSAESESDNGLYLPLSIKKFIWLSRETTSVMYAYSSGNNGNVSLYSESGELLGVMEGLELIKTSIDSVIRALRSSETLDVTLMTEIWKVKPNVCSGRVDLEKLPQADGSGIYSNKILNEVEQYSGDDQAYFEINKIFVDYVLKSIIECNWEWAKIGSELKYDKWKSVLPSSLNPQIIDSYVQELVRYGGHLKYDSESKKYIVLKDLPTIPQIDASIEKKIKNLRLKSTYDDVGLRFAQNFGENLTQVLQGKRTGLSVLFPEDDSVVGAIKFYSNCFWYLQNSELALALFLETVAPLSGTKGGVVRILEVGAGSGASSLQIMNKLKELNIPYAFTYTDISPLFVSEAKKKLGSEVTYGTLNIEEDPLSQGFVPGNYDVILAMQVLHATRDIKESLRNINTLLSPGGRVMISEQFRIEPSIAFPFGWLDGWWRFNDFRKMSPIINAAAWRECLESSGFEHSAATEMYDGFLGAVSAIKSKKSLIKSLPIVSEKSWMVFTDESSLSEGIVTKLRNFGRNTLIINLEDGAKYSENNSIVKMDGKSQESFSTLFQAHVEKTEGIIFFWSDGKFKNIGEDQNRYAAPLLHVTKAYHDHGQKLKRKPKIVLITRGVNYIGDTVSGNPSGATGWGLLKTFTNEYPEIHTIFIDVDQNESELEIDQVFSELWYKEREQFIGFRQEKKFVQRLVYFDKEEPGLSLPKTDRYKFINPPSGAFSDIQVGPYQKLEPTGGNVEILIKATALNFRDLFMVLKPEGFNLAQDQLDSIGLDISGIVVSTGPDAKKFKVGDAVFGFTSSGGLASHVIAPEKVLMRKPEWMTFNEASTIPCAFLTAYVCLVECAKVTKDDRVLVHVASGGVGLAAIQILKHIGAEIYATAGNKRKRAYLKNLGIKYIYHSRNTSYGEGIEKDTNGAGVTVVLNSLTGPNFKETTLGVCAPHARFLEIAKLNIWQPDEVKALRPDIKYDILDLSTMDTSDETEALFSEMEKYIHEGIYKGLPSVNFPLDQVRRAFYHFQEAKHIGKIVVSMPSAVYENGKLELKHEVFNTESTYLITGGLGGIGVEVTKWMLSSGAKHIVLAGRSEPIPRVAELLKEWNDRGANVVVIHTDIGFRENCVTLLEQIQKMGLPPLRGIMHAAGVLSDNFIPKQTWETVEMVFRPKVYGGWYLHELTLNYQLEFFVMFSSMTAVFAMLGQCNHVAANRFLDSLAYLRESMGLPAITINWGAWSDIGAAAHIKLGQEGGAGIRAFTPAQGIASLAKIMKSQKLQVGVIEVTDWALLKQILAGLGNYLENMKSDDRDDTKLSSEYESLVKEITDALPEDKQEKIQTYMERILRQTLKLPETEQIDIDQNFSELGVDSLMAMEMKNRLQGILGQKTLTVNSLQENRTVRSLSSHLASLLNSDSTESLSLDELIKIDSILPSDITIAPYEGNKKFTHILLTGATGHLGIHILSELLSQDSSLRITCLIRTKGELSGESRLRKGLEQYELFIDLSRVTVVEGDVRVATLGLEANLYKELVGNVDAICHCAILANHIDSYSDGTSNDMRTHNVLSLINVLRFASEEKTKPFFHASSLLAVTKMNESGVLSEEWPGEEDIGLDVKNGYSLSKFIGEKLLAEAERRGLPITCVRYPTIFGHSQNGIMPPGYNHAWNILLSCIRVRLFPQFFSKGLPIMPVDIAARASVHLFLSPSSECGVYNFTNDAIVSEEEIVSTFSSYGIQGEFVPFVEWRDAVFEEVGTTDLGPLASLYADEAQSERPNVYTLHPLATQTDTVNFSTLSEKIVRNIKGIKDMVLSPKEVLHRHLDYHFKTLKNN